MAAAWLMRTIYAMLLELFSDPLRMAALFMAVIFLAGIGHHEVTT